MAAGQYENDFPWLRPELGALPLAHGGSAPGLKGLSQPDLLGENGGAPGREFPASLRRRSGPAGTPLSGAHDESCPATPPGAALGGQPPRGGGGPFSHV